MWMIKSLVQLEKEGLVQLGRGKVISKRDLAANVGSYPVYSSSKVGDGKFGEYGLYMYDEELITWSVDGGGRLFHREKHKFSITNVTGFLRILDTSVLSYKYLFHALCLLHSKINFDWVKKAHPSVLRKEYLCIPLPPLAEQQRIVAKLDAAFAEIDKAIEIAQEAKKIASKIGEASIKGALANQYFEWQTIDLGTIAENLDAKRVPITKSKRVKGDVPYYGASGIVDYVDGHLFDEELLLISEDGANLLMRTYPIAFSVSGKIWVNNHAHVLRFSDRHTQKWVERYLNATDLANFISGMAQPKLNQKKLNSIKIPLPNGKYMNELLSVIDITKQKSEELVKVQSEKTLQLVQLKSSILAQELKPSEAA